MSARHDELLGAGSTTSDLNESNRYGEDGKPRNAAHSGGLVIDRLRPPDSLDRIEGGPAAPSEAGARFEGGAMHAMTGDRVAIIFKAWFANGSAEAPPFEESSPQFPKVIMVGDPDVMDGLNAAVVSLGLGEHAVVHIPAELATYPEGHGPRQPANHGAAACHGLRYDMEVIAIIPGHGKHKNEPILSERARSLQGMTLDSSDINRDLLPPKPQNWITRHLPQLNLPALARRLGILQG